MAVAYMLQGRELDPIMPQRRKRLQNQEKNSTLVRMYLGEHTLKDRDHAAAVPGKTREMSEASKNLS